MSNRKHGSLYSSREGNPTPCSGRKDASKIHVGKGPDVSEFSFQIHYWEAKQKAKEAEKYTDIVDKVED